MKQFTIKVGESISGQDGLSVIVASKIIYISDPTIVEIISGDKVIGVKPGIVTIIYSHNNFDEKINNYYAKDIVYPQSIVTITVLGVKDISIPANIPLVTGDNYTISPIITDSNADAILTWTSSNTNVATVNENGEVIAVSPGISTITCTEKNGVKAQSLVNVSPLLASSVSIDKKNCDLNVGESIQLLPTLSPENITSKNVVWLSSNDNVAQVDDEGNVTAISPGYCSIYAKADDGSGKFAKCLVHVLGSTTRNGDVNGDGVVNAADVVTITNIIFDNN